MPEPACGTYHFRTRLDAIQCNGGRFAHGSNLSCKSLQTIVSCCEQRHLRRTCRSQWAASQAECRRFDPDHPLSLPIQTTAFDAQRPSLMEVARCSPGPQQELLVDIAPTDIRLRQVRMDEQVVIAEFCDRAAKGGTAGCFLLITSLPDCYEKLIESLIDTGASSSQFLELCATRLVLTCPHCNNSYGGEVLGTMSIAGESSFFAGGAEIGRLLQGHCPNTRCRSVQIRLCWVDEDFQVEQDSFVNGPIARPSFLQLLFGGKRR